MDPRPADCESGNGNARPERWPARRAGHFGLPLHKDRLSDHQMSLIVAAMVRRLLTTTATSAQVAHPGQRTLRAGLSMNRKRHNAIPVASALVSGGAWRRDGHSVAVDAPHVFPRDPASLFARGPALDQASRATHQGGDFPILAVNLMHPAESLAIERAHVLVAQARKP